MDLYGYEAFLNGSLVDHELGEEQLAAALEKLATRPPARF
jgi:hypothetical protein